MKYLISVQINQNQSLTFRVEQFKLENGRCLFTDLKTGLTKNYPSEICLIEELRQ